MVAESNYSSARLSLVSTSPPVTVSVWPSAVYIALSTAVSLTSLMTVMEPTILHSGGTGLYLWHT